MQFHYNAFISYKHAPADIAVAREVQHRLEHFRVPKAIRKKTGRQKIERIFRDQEELPITSDLGRDIVRALNDAEFLIVICSTSTKYSTWVPREIEQFLKTHDRNHVLTVLVDGEPNDVIPSILCEETVVTEDASGNATEQKQVLEPLSCDYRNMKTARRTEIPRLAAALLGCSYDELIMRARQYKMRRLAAFASAAAVLISVAIGYLIWSNRQIRSNWQQAEENRLLAEANYAQAEENRLLAETNYAQAEANLTQAYRNQSVYLANESLNETKSENRVLAVQLALAALPSEEHPERPYTAVAEFAMHKAIATYTIRDYTTYRAVWNMSTRGTIEDYLVDPDQRLAFAYDYSGYVYAWDLLGHRTLFARQTGRTIRSLHIVHVGSRLCIAVMGSDAILLLDGISGETIWTYSKESVSLLAAFVDHDRIFVIENIYRINEQWASENLLEVLELDPSTGAEIFQSSPSPFSFAQSVGSVAFDEQNGRLCFVTRTYTQYDELRCCSLDTGEIETYPLDPLFTSLFTIVPLSDGRIVLYGISDGTGAFSMNGMVMLEQTVLSVRCVDTRTGKTLWNSQFTSSALQYIRNRKSCFACETVDTYGAPHALTAAICGNEIFFYDQDDGSLFAQFKTDSEIVNTDFTADGSRLMIEQHNGHFVLYAPGSTSALSIDMFRKELLDAERFPASDGNWIYIVKAGGKRLQIYENIWDENLLPFDGAVSYGSVSLQGLAEEDRPIVMMSGQFSDSRRTFDLYDPDEKKLIRSFSTDFDSTFIDLIGVDASFRYLIVQTSSPSAIYTVDVESGTLTDSFDLKEQSGGTIFGDCIVLNDRLCFSLRCLENNVWKNRLLFLLVQPDGTFAYEKEIDVPDGYLSPAIMANDRQTMLTVYETDRDARPYAPSLYDPATDMWSYLDAALTDNPVSADASASGSLFAVSDKQKAVVCGSDGKPLYEISDNARTVFSVRFCKAEDAGAEEDLLLVLSRDDQYHLDRYAAADGRFLGSTSLDSELSSVQQTVWTFSDGELALLMDGTLNIVNLTDWTVCLSADNVVHYSPSRRMLYFQSPDNDYLMMFAPRYSVAELIEFGKRFLNGETLSESERASYGIDP